MAFIRRKRRSNTYYFELVENRRVAGKVRQKTLRYFANRESAEKYAKKAYLTFKEADKEWIEPWLIERIEEKLARLNSHRPLPQNALQKLKEKFEVEMTYHSNAIEGNRLSLRETWLVLRKGMTIGGKSVAEHLEATNHLEALKLLEKLAAGTEKTTEEDVLNLHATILDKIEPLYAGIYRQEQVFIEGSSLIPPNWKRVPELMANVYAELNSKARGVEAIYSAVRIHHETVKIHPFVNGNGRLARLLMNLRLIRAGFPPTILRREERRGYYSALEKADMEDYRPLAMLIGKDVERALELYLDAMN